MDTTNLEFMINLLIQRISLIEQVNQDILRTQIKEQGMITGLHNTVQGMKAQVNAISIRQTAQGSSSSNSSGSSSTCKL